MWNRITLKERAKGAVRGNYWRCVIVSLVLTLFLGGGIGGSRSSYSSYTGRQENTEDFYESGQNAGEELLEESEMEPELAEAIGRRIAMALGLAFLLVIILFVFIFNMFEIGGCRFYMKNTEEPSFVRELFFAFQNGNYLKMVWVQLLRDLFVFLGMLLLVVPGIILAYSYRLVPYILAEHPELPVREVFRMSRERMDGNKWAAFVFDLSFLGWKLLGTLTFGILLVFWVNPYKDAADAELYLALRERDAQ
ncbi:MAG: DUF975 family protein [Eubacteriales bacterium]|nr:DUF975 family protein [Eubacteriales bacterium]